MEQIFNKCNLFRIDYEVMHKLLSQIVVVALLVLNIEGVSDLSGGSWDETSGHGSQHTHEVQADELPISLDTDSDCDSNQDHCSHGHAASLVGQVASINPDSAYQFHARFVRYLTNYAQAPPTPPPNA